MKLLLDAQPPWAVCPGSQDGVPVAMEHSRIAAGGFGRPWPSQQVHRHIEDLFFM